MVQSVITWLEENEGDVARSHRLIFKDRQIDIERKEVLLQLVILL